MHSMLIITLFLIVKVFQWLNSFVLIRLLGIDKSYDIMIGIFIFIVAVFVIGLLFKKFFPKYINIAWIVMLLVLIVVSYINSLSIVILLTGLFLYALIAAESQVLESLSSYRKIPKYLIILISLLPIVISYIYPQFRIAESQIFYIVSSLLAFSASYSAQVYGGGKSVIYKKAPPIWLGLSFLIGSGIFYYIEFNKITENSSILFFPLILLFYIGGALIVYMNIDKRLQEIE